MPSQSEFKTRLGNIGRQETRGGGTSSLNPQRGPRGMAPGVDPSLELPQLGVGSTQETLSSFSKAARAYFKND